MMSCGKEEVDIIGITERFHIISAHVQDEYEIMIYLPPAYDPSSNQNQLVLGLDGDFHFNTVATMISDMAAKGMVPPSVFVAVGNSKSRNRDYTPTAFKHGSGGAANFYQFLIRELIPELEARYGIDPAPTKALMGNSFGGLFTHYAMFQNRATSPFNTFVAVGCSYWFDSGVIFEYEQEYAQAHNDLPVRFFNAMGTLEGGVSLASFEEMNERLKSRAYAGFEGQATYIEKHGHKGAAKVGFEKGLAYVFNK